MQKGRRHKMLFMSIATWAPEKRDEILKRRMEKGAMVPDGVKVIGEWVDLSGGRSFMVYEGDDPKALAQWGLAWNDLIKDEAVVVMDAEAAMKLL
jgi:hypothetical protein